MVSAIGKVINILGFNTSFSNKSIKGRANNYIATFPLVASDGINFEELEAITALEDAKRALEFSLVISNTTLEKGNDLKALKLHTNGRSSAFESINASKDMFNRMSVNEATLTRQFRDFKLETIGKGLLDEESGLFKFNSDHSTFAINESIMLAEEGEIKDSVDPKIKNPLTVSDINRANRALPMMLKVETRPSDKQSIPFSFSMGLRTVSVLAPGRELQYVVSNQTIGHKFLRKFARVFSGDFPEMGQIFLSLFKLDSESRKIARMSEPARRLYRMNGLFDENRSKAAFGAISKIKSNAFIPNMTLVLSKNDVDELRQSSGINILEDTKEAAKIFNQFMLIDLYVVDQVRDRFYEFTQGSWEERRLSDVVSIMNQDIISARKKREELDEKSLRQTLGRI